MQCQESPWFSETQAEPAPEFNVQRLMLNVRKELNLDPEHGSLNVELERS